MFKDLIPYTPTVLAQVLRHQVGTIEKALKVFLELGLIEILDNGAIYMLDIQNFIGKSSTEADRIRNYRNQIKNAKDGVQMLQQMNDNSTPEIERKKELEKEKDLEVELEVKKNTIVTICRNKGIELSTNAEEFITNCLRNGMTVEIISYAISEAIDRQIKSWCYIQKILNRYIFEDYKTIEEVKQDTASREKQSQPAYNQKFYDKLYAK